MSLPNAINVNSPELDYSAKINNHSTAIYRSITPQGSSSITLPTTAGVVGPVEFIMPPSVFNPSKCKINFDVSFPAPTVGTDDDKWLAGNIATMFNRVVLYDSATSAIICDVNNFQNWTSMIAPASIPLSRYLNKSATDDIIPSATQALALVQPLDIISRSNDDDSAVFRGLTTTVVQGAAFTGRDTFRISTPGNAVSYYSVSLDFADVFKFTALSLDKNIYNPANMVLQVYFNAGDSFLFNCASAVDATTPVSSPAGTVSNLQVQLANEANLNLVAQTIDLVMRQGVTLPVAYPTVTRQTFSATTAPSFQLQLTSGYGKRILFLASSPFGLAGTGINANNYHGIYAANGTTQVLTQYQTTLNSVPIKTPAGFNVLKGDDYNIGNKTYLMNSPTQSLGYYRSYDWVHIDSFFGEKPLSEVDQTEVDGIDVVTQSQTFGFQGTTTNVAQTWVTAIVGQKMLSLTSQGAIMA